MNHYTRLKHCEDHVCLITGSQSPIYEKLDIWEARYMRSSFVDLCDVTQFAWFAYLQGFVWGEKESRKMRKNYYWTWTPVVFFRVPSHFLADLLRFHLVTIPTFALSFKILPRMSAWGESKGTRHQWSGSEGGDPMEPQSGPRLPRQKTMYCKRHSSMAVLIAIE